MKKKRLLALLMVLVLAFCFAGSALADGVQPRWKNISVISGGVTDCSRAGYHNVDGGVALYNGDYKAGITVTLQKYYGGWQDQTSWYTAGLGGTGVHRELQLASGVYRVKIQVDVYSTSGAMIETTTVYTGEHTV